MIRRRTRKIQLNKSPVGNGRFRLAESDCVRKWPDINFERKKSKRFKVQIPVKWDISRKCHVFVGFLDLFVSSLGTTLRATATKKTNVHENERHSNTAAHTAPGMKCYAVLEIVSELDVDRFFQNLGENETMSISWAIFRKITISTSIIAHFNKFWYKVCRQVGSRILGRNLRTY